MWELQTIQFANNLEIEKINYDLFVIFIFLM
jgi:hypothetical protein